MDRHTIQALQVTEELGLCESAVRDGLQERVYRLGHRLGLMSHKEGQQDPPDALQPIHVAGCRLAGRCWRRGSRYRA